MPDQTHRSESTSHTKGLFHGLLTGPVTIDTSTSTGTPANKNNNMGGHIPEPKNHHHHEKLATPSHKQSKETPQSQTKPLMAQVKESLLSKLFTPAPDPQQQDEPKLLFDEDIRRGLNMDELNQISSTEASIQKLNTAPVPDDDGPQMIFEKDSTPAEED